MDEHETRFVETFRQFLQNVVNQTPVGDERLTPLGDAVEEFVGQSIRTMPVITHTVAAHRLVDADVALASIASDCATTARGVTGGQQRDHCSLPELLISPFMRFAEGPADYVSLPDGPDSSRRVVSFGLYFLTSDGVPLVALQRQARPDHGRNFATIEILTASAEAATSFLQLFEERMLRLSVLRGHVLTFTGNEYVHSAAGATFLQRPSVAAEAVILAPGVLDTVVRHVVGIGEQRERLREAGQHLKRGVLLYGPPGTGKTLTVRHLLSRTAGTTSVLLTGQSLRFISEAAELARAMQPAIVVLEDVDLVASERSFHEPQPLLFAVLDALDGLEGDADVTFILTTNRVDVLERALAERPGRIDLAVEIALPDDAARRRLFRHYGAGLPLSSAALDAAAEHADGTTASFAKELVRRAVLLAAEQEREVTDDDLRRSLDDLRDASAQLARNLLGGGEGS